MLTTAHQALPNSFGLAAIELLECAQAAGVHHQSTPVTRTPAAATPTRSSKSGHSNHATASSASIWWPCIHVAIFFAALTGFMTGALALPIHPFAAVLLTLGAMVLLLHALAGLLHVRGVHSGVNRGENEADRDSQLY